MTEGGQIVPLKALKTKSIHSDVIFYGSNGKVNFLFFRLCPLGSLRSAFIKTICLAPAACSSFN